MKQYREHSHSANNAPLVVLLIMFLSFGYFMHTSFIEHVETLRNENRQILELSAPKELQVTVLTEDPISLPKGITNNNPGNIKNKGWQGQIGSDTQGHAIFSHYEYGLRAIAMTLKNYQKKHGLKTLRAMMKRYCEGNQLAYAKYISTRLGIGIDEEFDVMAVMPEMLKAIVTFENGMQPYPDHVYALAGVYTNAND